MSARMVVEVLAGLPGRGPAPLPVSSVSSVSQGGAIFAEPVFWLVAAVLLAGTLALGMRAGHAGIDPRALWRNERDLRRPGRIWRRYARILLAAVLLTGACALGAALVALVIGVALVAGAGAVLWYWLRIGADRAEPRTSAADRRILGQPDPYPYLREPACDDLPGDLPGEELAGPDPARPPDPAPPGGVVVLVTRNPKET
jgi:hypothetical protein